MMMWLDQIKENYHTVGKYQGRKFSMLHMSQQ